MGDVAADAYRDYHGHVYRFLLRRTRDHHEAEELTQRVFVDAAIALQSAEARPRSVLAWLFAIAERRFVDEVRRGVVKRRSLNLLGRPEEAEDLAYSREVARALRTLIADLPDDQREVVVMKVLEGRPFAEIAARLGTTEAACKMRLSRAIAVLKRQLDERGLGPDG
jgi:RNA polymerase sigma-70 factor (ECF subfamily)